MPTYIRDGSWRLVKDIFVRIGNAWRTVNTGWVWVGGAWKLVHSGVLTPYPSGNIVIRDYLDTNIIDNDIYIANTGDTLYGRRGPTWENNPTAFEYRWRFSNFSGGPYQDFSPAQTTTTHPSLLNTASPLSRIDAWDDRWIIYQVRAQNSFGFSEWFSSINEAHLVKYAPENITVTITGTPAPGVTLTASSTWDNTFLNANDQSPATIQYEWYDDTTNEFLGSGTTYTPSVFDLDRFIRVEATATNTGGSTKAVSAPVGPVVTVLAVDIPYIMQDNGGFIVDNRGGIINGVTARTITTIYGITSGTSYRVRYRYKSISSGSTVYYLDGAVSTENGSWITYTANGAGVGTISSVVVDSVNQVAELYDDHYVDETYYNGSTYGTLNLARWLVDIEISAIKTGTSRVIRTLTYGISAAPLPTIVATPATAAANSDVVFSGTISGLGGNPAYPKEYFIDFGDGFIDYQAFSAGARNPTYSITHQYENIGTYTATITTDPDYTSASASVNVVLIPGYFDIISVSKGLTNGSTRPVTVTWEQSPNATQYEVEIQSKFSTSPDWVTRQTFDASTFIYEPTRTATFNITGAKFYRASVRARKDFDLGTAAYSGGGTLTSPVYVEAVGTAPGAPTSLTAGSITTTTASISFTIPSSGSAPIINYEWSADFSTWNSSGGTTSPIFVSGLTNGASVTIYIRAINNDDLTGPAGFVTFTTVSAPGAFNIISAIKSAYDSNIVARPLEISWGQSVNANRYEIEIQARDYHPIVFPNSSQTWITLRSLANSPFFSEPTQLSVTNRALTSNVATLTTSQVHNLQVGQSVTISNVNTTFNGTYRVSAIPSSTTFSYPKTSANVASGSLFPFGSAIGLRTETYYAAFYWQYRVTARARSGFDLANAAYSNGGTSTSLVYFDATGTGPTKPTIGTITVTKISASVEYSAPTSSGSSSIALTQWTIDEVNYNNVTSSPFTISSLTGGTNYTVYMRAYNADGIVSPTDSKTFTTTASRPPKVPTSPTTSGVTKTNITFSWTAPVADTTNLAATGYDYFTSTTSTAPLDTTTPTGSTTTAVTISFTYTASTAPTLQYFWVRAKNADGNSSWTTSVNATPTASKPPLAPTGLTATKNSTTPTTQIDIAWTAPTTNTSNDAATGYDIYYASGATAPTAPTDATAVTTTSTTVSKAITGLSSNTRYWFWVRSTNADGRSTWTGPANATTDQAVTAPNAPTNVSVGTLTYSHPILDLATSLTRISATAKTQSWTYSARVSIPISWTKPAGATDFEIFVSSTNNAPATATAGNLTTSTGDVSTFTQTLSQNNRGTISRFYWVKAKNSAGSSGWSSAATFTSTATVVSGLLIRIFRGNGTSSSTPSPTPPANTAMSYPWTNLINRDANNEGHYATIALTIAGTADTGVSNTV